MGLDSGMLDLRSCIGLDNRHWPNPVNDWVELGWVYEKYFRLYRVIWIW